MLTLNESPRVDSAMPGCIPLLWQQHFYLGIRTLLRPQVHCQAWTSTLATCITLVPCLCDSFLDQNLHLDIALYSNGFYNDKNPDPLARRFLHLHWIVVLRPTSPLISHLYLLLYSASKSCKSCQTYLLLSSQELQAKTLFTRVRSLTPQSSDRFPLNFIWAHGWSLHSLYFFTAISEHKTKFQPMEYKYKLIIFIIINSYFEEKLSHLTG